MIEKLPAPEYVISSFNDVFGYGYFTGRWDKDGRPWFTSALSEARHFKKLSNAEKTLKRMKNMSMQRKGKPYAGFIVPVEMAEAYDQIRYEKAWKEAKEIVNGEDS